MGKINRSIEIARFLYTQRVAGFDPPADAPHMDPESVDRFRTELEKASRYLEYGSGGSTVMADRLGIAGTSVESDRFYARAVATRLRGNSIRQICVPVGVTVEWGKPLFPSPAKGRRYVDAPFAADDFPDFILVDGRWRRACALNAASKARARGASAVLMIDDYLHRPGYTVVEGLLGTPEMVGRSALFTIGSQVIPQVALEEALADPF